MFRGLARGLFAGIAPAALLCALLLAPAGADQPATAPQPSATTYGESIIQPLREIGHVKARTAFCKAFLAHAALGLSSAIDFEQSLLDTVSDFRSAKLGDELNKHKSLKKLEKDLNRLADLSLAGRAELEELKSLETDPDRHAALLGFVDALNGAKGRQMDVARKLSRTYGIIAEQPVYTIVTLPATSPERQLFGGAGNSHRRLWRPEASSIRKSTSAPSSFEASFSMRCRATRWSDAISGAPPITGSWRWRSAAARESASCET